jgi:hypothetical protein
MNKPLVVSLPHKLSRKEATRRLQRGLSTLSSQFGAFIVVEEENWHDHHLDFKINALKQDVSGAIDVGEDQVRVEVVLPWLLARLAHTAQTLIQHRGALLLEKK